MNELTRRQALLLGGSALAVVALNVAPAPAQGNGIDEQIAKFTGGQKPEEGRVALELPEIAENGNTVPISVKVDSPMTEDDYVKRVMVLADANPRPGVAVFHFTPAAGVAEAATRMRLAKTQNVLAIAEMSNGKYFLGKREVKVTIGGCG